ncbi:MAG TPA: hypothetical protein VIF57_06665 [Polyangia bacterium]
MVVDAPGGLTGFARLLQESIAILARESPAHLAATRNALGQTIVRISVAGEAPARLVPGRGHDWVQAAEGPAAVEARLDIATLFEVLDGALTVEQAVRGDRLAISGGVDDLLRGHDALGAWLHGALRCPSFTELLQRMRNQYAAQLGSQDRRNLDERK